MIDVPLSNMLGLWPFGEPSPQSEPEHLLAGPMLPQPVLDARFLATLMGSESSADGPKTPDSAAPPALPRPQPQPWSLAASGSDGAASSVSQAPSTCVGQASSPFRTLDDTTDAQDAAAAGSSRCSERLRRKRPSWLLSFRAAANLGGPWDEWELPATLTTAAGTSNAVSAARMLDHLLARFYAQPSFNSLVVAQPERLMARLRRDAPDPAPGFLLRTIAACAAGLPESEPELRACAARLLDEAHEDVWDVLRAGEESLELIQALLLLAANWPGEPDCEPRRKCLHSALELGAALGLERTSQLYESPGPPVTRYVLLWCLYLADKLDCVAVGGEPARLKAARIDWCMPTPERVAEVLGNEPGPHALRLAQLAAGGLALARVLEDVLEALYAPITAVPPTLEELEQRTRVMERRLEQVCFSQRHLLHVPHWPCAVDVLCIDTISRLVHLIQLILYRSVLVARICATLAVAHAQGRQISTHNFVNFSDATEERALSASIESAWHLLHPPGYRLQTLQVASVASFSRAAIAPDARLDCARFGAVMGARLLAFVARYWSSWEEGLGVVFAVPRLVSSQQSRQAARQLRARAHTDPGAEPLRWRTATTPARPAAELALHPAIEQRTPVQAFVNAGAARRDESLSPAYSVFGVDVQTYLHGVARTQRQLSHSTRPGLAPLPPPSYEAAVQQQQADYRRQASASLPRTRNIAPYPLARRAAS